MSTIKTAITLPQDLHKRATRWSKQRGVSRSRLIADALREYLHQHTREEMTRRISLANPELDSAEKRLLEDGLQQFRKLVDGTW